MIMHKFKIISFICIVFVTLQTGHSSQENCAKFDTSLSCKDNHVEFFWKIAFGAYFHELDVDKPNTIEGLDLNRGKKIKFIIHGHGGFQYDIAVYPLQEEYFALDYTVILINYHELAKTGCYRTAIENSLMISTCAARMIEAIIQCKEVGLDDFHLLGFSLGAQLGGQMPHLLNRDIVGDGKFSRITGIDPAFEGFFEDYSSDEYTLTESDAELVDVVHSNSGFVGEFRNIGYVDWYPNGGIFQPGCHIGDKMCNHFRSLLLFLESIGNPDFKIVALRCPYLETKFLNLHPPCQKIDAIPFGENFVKDETNENGGIYFFQTRGSAPYIRRNANTNYTTYIMHLDIERYFGL